MNILSLYYSTTEFLDKGGFVLYGIFIMAFVLWFLVIERWLYFIFSAGKEQIKLTRVWHKNSHNENARRIRESLLFTFRHDLLLTLPVIRTLVRVTPLMGLFGTVYGMVEIFDVIAIQGTGDARAMADGISLATLPTMAGMAVGIIGLFLLRHIETTAKRKINRFSEGMVEP